MIANATIQKEHLIVKISIANMSTRDQELIADMLLDSFVVDDAYYDRDEKVIMARNWEGEVDVQELQAVLDDILCQVGVV